MSKAFDFIPDKILLSKLEKYGITGKSLDWIKTYLENRHNVLKYLKYVETRRKYSLHSLCNNGGVPQNSVLGLLLF